MKKLDSYSVSDLLFSEENLFSTQAATPSQKNDFRSNVLSVSSELLTFYGQVLEDLPIFDRDKIAVMNVSAVRNEETKLVETNSNFEFVSDTNLKSQLEADLIDPIKSVQDNISAWSSYALIEYCRALEAGSIIGPNAELQLQLYRNLKTLLVGYGEYKGVDPAYVVLGFFHKGLKTGVNASFDLVRSVPLAYYRSENKFITVEELEETVMNSFTLLIHLSSMQLKPFVILKNFAKVTRPKSFQMKDQFAFDFPDDFFYYDSEKRQLKIKKEILIQWRQIIEEGNFLDTKRIGCPARQPVAGGKNSTIQILLKLQMNNFCKYVGPHLERYTLAWANA